jgi:hypothetical protein
MEMEKKFSNFDLGFGYLSPLSPRKKSKRKKNHSALPAPM